jgi:hypothetical protein
MHVLDGNVTALPVLSLVLDQISYVEHLVFLMRAFASLHEEFYVVCIYVILRTRCRTGTRWHASES